MVFDGAMGTMIQSYDLTESDFRGDRFTNHVVDLKGNNDLLCLTRPDIVGKIHKAYFEEDKGFLIGAYNKNSSLVAGIVVLLEEQIAYHALQKREKYAQEDKDRKQRELDKEIERNTPQFSGNPIGIKAQMEYEKKKKQDEANNKKK